MPETCPIVTRQARYVDPEPAETCDAELTPEGLCPIHDADGAERDWWAEAKDALAEAEVEARDA